MGIEHKPQYFCMAPWIHAFHHSDYQRTACCTTVNMVKRPKDVIDQTKFISHNEFKNSELMRNIRLTMLRGEMPADCANCYHNTNNLNDSYVHWFNKTYGNLYDQVMSQTNFLTGEITCDPVSFDYRIGNSCNSKCKHCMSTNSSLIEFDEKQLSQKYQNHQWIKYINTYKSPPSDIREAQHAVLRDELLNAVRERRLKDIRWLGGESLFSPLHWEVMKELSESDDINNVSVLYITNLSIMSYKGIKLIDIINKDFQSVLFHCSTEGGGDTYNYVRNGLDWNNFKNNFELIASKANKQLNKWKGIKLAFTINNLSLIDLDEYFSFMLNMKETYPNTTYDPHFERVYSNGDYDDRFIMFLHPMFLGPFKQSWLERFRAILSRYMYRFSVSTENAVNEIDGILKVIEQESSIDFDNISDFDRDTYRRIFQLGTDLEAMDKTYILDLVQKDPLMLEWYNWLSSNLR